MHVFLSVSRPPPIRAEDHICGCPLSDLYRGQKAIRSLEKQRSKVPRWAYDHIQTWSYVCNRELRMGLE